MSHLKKFIFFLVVGLVIARTALASEPTFPEFTKKSEISIKKGTAWLLRTINRDGGCGIDIHQRSDIACTAVVGLSLLTQGSTSNEGPYRNEVRKLLNYIIRAVDQMPHGDITSVRNTQLQGDFGRHIHTLYAALFLSQIVGEESGNTRVRSALQKLLPVIARTQHSDGTWGTQCYVPALATGVGWLSIRASLLAGFRVEASYDKTEKKLLQWMSGKAHRQSWRKGLHLNAPGIRAMYVLNRENEPLVKEAVEYAIRAVRKNQTPFGNLGGEEYLAIQMVNQSLLQAGGENWKQWFPTVRDKLVRVQNKDGSWTGHHCVTSRTYCTATVLMILTSPNRFVPFTQQ